MSGRSLDALLSERATLEPLRPAVPLLWAILDAEIASAAAAAATKTFTPSSGTTASVAADMHLVTDASLSTSSSSSSSTQSFQSATPGASPGSDPADDTTPACPLVDDNIVNANRPARVGPVHTCDLSACRIPANGVASTAGSTGLVDGTSLASHSDVIDAILGERHANAFRRNTSDSSNLTYSELASDTPKHATASRTVERLEHNHVETSANEIKTTKTADLGMAETATPTARVPAITARMPHPYNRHELLVRASTAPAPVLESVEHSERLTDFISSHGYEHSTAPQYLTATPTTPLRALSSRRRGVEMASDHHVGTALASSALGAAAARRRVKLAVPADKYPEYNFVGRLLGPRGTTLKTLERETGCKIMIRGRGSIRKDKEADVRGKPGWEHVFNEPLHVVIETGDGIAESDAMQALARAKEAVQILLIPVPEERDGLKRQQLRDLAILNGTFRGSSVAPMSAPPPLSTVSAARQAQTSHHRQAFAASSAVPHHTASDDTFSARSNGAFKIGRDGGRDVPYAGRGQQSARKAPRNIRTCANSSHGIADTQEELAPSTGSEALPGGLTRLSSAPASATGPWGAQLTKDVSPFGLDALGHGFLGKSAASPRDDAPGSAPGPSPTFEDPPATDAHDLRELHAASALSALELTGDGVDDDDALRTTMKSPSGSSVDSVASDDPSTARTRETTTATAGIATNGVATGKPQVPRIPFGGMFAGHDYYNGAFANFSGGAGAGALTLMGTQPDVAAALHSDKATTLDTRVIEGSPWTTPLAALRSPVVAVGDALAQARGDVAVPHSPLMPVTGTLTHAHSDITTLADNA